MAVWRGTLRGDAGGDNGSVGAYTVNVLVGKGMLGRCELGILSGTGVGSGGGTTRESWELSAPSELVAGVVMRVLMVRVDL